MNFISSYYPNFIRNTTPRKGLNLIRPIGGISPYKRYAKKDVEKHCDYGYFGVVYFCENIDVPSLHHWEEINWGSLVSVRTDSYLCSSQSPIVKNIERYIWLV